MSKLLGHSRGAAGKQAAPRPGRCGTRSAERAWRKLRPRAAPSPSAAETSVDGTIKEAKKRDSRFARRCTSGCPAYTGAANGIECEMLMR